MLKIKPFRTRRGGAPSFWLLWILAFTYALVVALVLQKLVMPIMPSLHAGHGLMNNDAILFHDIAVAMADRIHSGGWSEWKLIPNTEITANVGILAAIYAVFGADPVWFIPLSAGFHALGAILILQVGLRILPGKCGWIGGGVAALMFLVFPSSLVWYGQNHKDSFLIAGYLLMLLGFVRAFDHQTLLKLLGNAALVLAGCGLVAIMRPHMPLVYSLAFGLAWILLALANLNSASLKRKPIFESGLLLLCVIMVTTFMLPNSSRTIEVAYRSVQEGPVQEGPVQEGLMNWHWKNTGFLPMAIDKKLGQMSYIRAHFIFSGKKAGAKSIMDGELMPNSASTMAAYLPRAFGIGLFSPFPNSWLKEPTVPSLIGAIETLLFYLMAPGVLIMLWRRPSSALVFCLVSSALVLVVLSYTSPNIGTLHRIRYGPWFVFLLAGACGWALLLSQARSGLRKLSSPNDFNNASILAVESTYTSPASHSLSGSKAIGSGALVTMVSMLGAFGLLIRDLLLINRNSFGESLDSFYLAMMIPMLFVSIFSLPLGDAITAAFHRCERHEKIQSLIGFVSSLTLVVFGALCLALYMISGSIYRSFVADGNIVQIQSLFPITLLLFLFSGIVVTGNSLLNTLSKQGVVALAQLIVPFIAVAAVIISPDKQLVMNATIGMFIGQIFNLLIIIFYVRREGYYLLPGSLQWVNSSGLFSNYTWLVVSALLASLSIPYNYWLAGQLGVGAISVWGIGSKLVQIVLALGVSMMTAVWVPYFSKLVAAELHLRIRGEVYLSLLAATWGGSLVALIIFGFTSPIIEAAMPNVEQAWRVNQLAGVIQLGALQIPFLLAGLMLVKLSAVSEASWKVVVATLTGLIANMLLGYMWLPIWGLFGIAAAWCVATLLSTLVIMMLTGAQSFLSWVERISIVVSWLVLFALALAFYLKSVHLATGAIILFALVLFVQFKLLIKGRAAPQNLVGH